MSSSLASTIPGHDTGNIPVLDRPAAVSDDVVACQKILHGGSKSFYLAAKLLPMKVRKPAAVLYAFCRLADDAIDLEGGGGTALFSLAERLDRIYGGRPADDPMERALTDVVWDYRLPRAVFDALIEGLTWDAEGRSYETLSDLRAYAARVASTVGVATTLLMGVRSGAALARAADLGVAMQLTNIARDVGEDARAGRLYLPRTWMRDAGFNPDAWLAEPVFDDRLAKVINRQLSAADDLYRRATGGIALLPYTCRPGIHAARLIYAEIGREIVRRGMVGLDRRTVVSTRRKTFLLGMALIHALVDDDRNSDSPPLAETRFLIDAVHGHPLADAPVTTPSQVPWWNFDERIGRTIELFARLKQEEQLRRVGSRR